jgi:hypothetical protein
VIALAKLNLLAYPGAKMDGTKLFGTYFYDDEALKPLYAAGEANFGTKNTREDDLAAMQVP